MLLAQGSKRLRSSNLSHGVGAIPFGDRVVRVTSFASVTWGARSVSLEKNRATCAERTMSERL
jgi:hypothetical protein